MGIVPGQLTSAPEPLRRRYGLFTAASGPVDLPLPHGRGGGVRFIPVTCGVAHPYPVQCYDGLVEVPEDGKPVDDPDHEFETGVFAVVASEECGSAGFTAAEFEARVRRRLDNGEQGAAELALWTGLDPDGNALGIPHLAETTDTVTVSNPMEIQAVVAALEDWAYRVQGYGHVAYIHAPVAVAAWAADADLVIQDGPLKITPYGSVWIFGGGYPGTGASGALAPDGGAYIHVTGQVQVWRAPDPVVYPANQTMNRTTNQRLLIAEREYAISFDCMNGRALFDPLGGVS